jgi:hypothetical protein
MERMEPNETINMLQAHFNISARELAKAQTEKERQESLNNCNALLDAYIDISTDMAKLAIKKAA